MPPSIRQQRQALRRQRQAQHRARRQGSRRRTFASPHLSRRVRSYDLQSLDEYQRRIAQAILSRRQQTRSELSLSETRIYSEN